MSNAFASAIFLYRNSDKVRNGDATRKPVVLAQAGSLVDKVAKTDSKIGQSTKATLDAFEKSSTLSVGSKAVDAAGKLVNPLIIASSCAKVINSDDKEATLYQEAGGIGTMFAFEHAMKKDGVKSLVKEKSEGIIKTSLKGLAKKIKPIAEMSEESSNKIVKLGGFILSGIAFVAASMTGYSVGAEAGADTINKKRAKEQTNTAATAPQTMAYEEPQEQNLQIES